MRQETGDRRKETGYMRQKTIGRMHETEDKRQVFRQKMLDS